MLSEAAMSNSVVDSGRQFTEMRMRSAIAIASCRERPGSTTRNSSPP